MATTAKPFRNKDNFAKYQLLYFEPGVTVLLTTLQWCYRGQLPIEDHLADLGATNSLRKKNNINATEQNTLEELKEGKTNLNNLDVTLLYKIIQLTCDLMPRDDITWTKDCPTSQQRELEFLLFKLKDGRNSLAHPHDEHKNITDLMVEDKCKEMKDLLAKLLQAAAFKGTIPPVKLNEVLDYIQDDVQTILNGENICSSMKSYTLNLIFSDLKSKFCYNNKTKSNFIKELKVYSAPSLHNKEDILPLKEILQKNNAPIIVVQGEAGRGKTAMSRFLFNSWLSGNTDPVEGLSSFDVVLRIICNQISSSDINQFYETQFPNASFAFPNTNSFKKSLDEFKVFWIMDGFDESTAEFKGFLETMIKSLSDKHKILITTRPNTYCDLKGYLCKLPMTSLTLELFQDHNVDEIIQSLIIDDDNKKTFKTHFHSRDEPSKLLLRTPLNLNLYIKLWIQDPELVRDTYTTKMLFLKTTSNNLRLLEKRLIGPPGRTSWSSEDLKGYLKDWLYGSLCKQSFLMLMHRRYSIRTEDLDTLKKDARNSKLDPSSCLSTFLLQVEESDYEKNNECDEKNDKDEVERDENKLEEWDEENDWETSYMYHHLTQQYILASLFLKHFNDYDGDRVITSFNIGDMFFELPELLNFYVAMVNEDGSLNADPKQVFRQVQKIINLGLFNNAFYKTRLLISTSVASNFNEKYMELISEAFEDIPCLKIHEFKFDSEFPGEDLNKFLKFVHPQKLLIYFLDSTIPSAKEEGFQSLLNVLIKSQIAIVLRRHVNKLEVIDFHNDKYLGFLRNNKGHLLQKCIRSQIYFDEFNGFCEDLKLDKNRSLEQLKLLINFYSFSFPSRLLSLPKGIVENTTIGLANIQNENFEKVLEFLFRIKGDQTLKFKSIHLQLEDISETGKQQLLGIAHKSYDCPTNQSSLSQYNDAALNITAFDGNFDSLDLLKNHHENLKDIKLYITSESEFYRMLKFLHDNKNLRDVWISLGGRSFSYFQYWEQRIFFDTNITLPSVLTFPKELVPRTKLFLPYINQENFDEFFTLLNNVRGGEILKFKECYFKSKCSLSLDQRKMLAQITYDYHFNVN